jgi:hypothetical protein
MFQTVVETTESYKSVWELVPIFAMVFKELKDLLAKILVVAKAAGVDLKGVTEGKNNTLDELATLLYEVCSNLALFAARNKNASLHAKVFLAESEIKGKKDGDLIIFANEVLDLVNQYKASLTDYAITEADITRLTALIADATKELPTPGSKYSDRKAAHAELERLFDETSDFLDKQVDTGVTSLRAKSSAFYNAYFASRNIKNIGIRHEKPEAPATEK